MPWRVLTYPAAGRGVSAPVAERRLRECAEALEDLTERVYQARERP